MMKLECEDLDYALRERSPELLAALQEHAGVCPACADALRRWEEISRAASTLRREWDSPALWPRIAGALAREQAASAGRPRRFFSRLRGLSGPRWQTAAAALGLIALAMLFTRVLTRGPQPDAALVNAPDPEAHRRLLTEQALREIEIREAAYVHSIEVLSRLAEPRVQAPSTPLMAAYREKLLLLDQAIGDCRAEIESNRFNANLRTELIAIYKDKQGTLEDIMRIRQNDQR
jgi:hypothetical protein